MQTKLLSLLILPLLLQATDIDAAIKRGQNTPVKELWKQIRKKNGYRINRAGLDPIEKKIVLLWDEDRISLEVAEAKRQMRPISAGDVRRIPTGIVDVLLESNCYNSLYVGSLAKWTPAGGVHLVLNVNGQTIQPGAMRNGGTDAVTVLPVERGIVAKSGNMVTYVPLYRSAFYERESDRAWFSFHLADKPRTLSAIVIAGDGKKKEKTITLATSKSR